MSVSPLGGRHLAGVGPLVELQDQLVHARWARPPGGEEAHVQQHVAEADGLDVAAAHVHHVADGVEREERDADGQQDVEDRRVGVRSQAAEGVGGRGDEEAVVLEHPQHRQVGRHRQSHQPAALGRAVARRHGPVRGQGQRPVEPGRRHEVEHEAQVDPAVEVQAEGHHRRPPDQEVGPQRLAVKAATKKTAKATVGNSMFVPGEAGCRRLRPIVPRPVNPAGDRPAARQFERGTGFDSGRRGANIARQLGAAGARGTWQERSSSTRASPATRPGRRS